jgi:hypothetical protein
MTIVERIVLLLIGLLILTGWCLPVLIAWRRRTRHLWWIATLTFGRFIANISAPPDRHDAGWWILWIPMFIMALIGKLRAADRKQGGAA